MGAAIITVFENNGNDTLIVSLFNGFNFFLDIYIYVVLFNNGCIYYETDAFTEKNAFII